MMREAGRSNPGRGTIVGGVFQSSHYYYNCMENTT